MIRVESLLSVYSFIHGRLHPSVAHDTLIAMEKASGKCSPAEIVSFLNDIYSVENYTSFLMAV